MKKFYKNKKILITGVTGFKGAWLSQWLISLGAKVYGIGYNPNQNKNLFYKLNLQKKVKTKLFDIRNYKKLKNLIKNIKPSIIFHLAAQPLIYVSYKKPHLTFDVNYRGTLNLLEISRGINSIKSIVVVTSDKCYESNNSSKGFKETDLLGGIDPYSASKSSTEIMVRAYRKTFFTNKKNVGLSTARAGNVIGGGDWSLNRLIPDCVRSLIKNKVIEIRNPNFNRPWQHVLEPLKGYLILAMQQFKNPKRFSGAWNFGTKPNSLTNVRSIVNYIIEFWGTGKLKIRQNKLYEQQNLQLNINKATKYLKWYPTYNIKQSVRFTTDWYLKVLKYKKKPSLVTLDQIIEYEKDSKIS
tara:strand:- start:1462 stop:2523 length:1062 start_codon:yes stop_codon:yes gene_type:complete